MTDPKQADSPDDKGNKEKVHEGKVYAAMSVEEKRQLPNLAICRMWLNQMVEINHIESTSYEVYHYRITSLMNYLNSIQKRIMDIDVKSVLDYKNYMDGLGKSKVTVNVQLALIKRIFAMLHDMGVKEFVWPVIIRHKRYKSITEYRVPTAAQIFAIRRKQHVRIRDITLFELLLCSGARIGEVAQMRASDITFEHKVLDKELNRLSPFIGGYMTILPKRSRIKTQRGKIVYFSTYAAKWLKKYMELMSADKYPHIPLFACHRNNANRWMFSLGFGIFSNMPVGSRLINKTMDEMKRKPGFGDINVDDLKDVPENIRKMIRTHQKVDAERRGQHELMEKMEEAQYANPKKDCLHLHALRHFYAGCMRHRSFDGSRGNLVMVQKLLHHTNLSQTEVYLKKVQSEISDEEWKRIMLGRISDWPDASLSLQRNNRKAKILEKGDGSKSNSKKCRNKKQ